MTARRIVVCDPTTGSRVAGTVERRADGGPWPLTFTAVVDGETWAVPCDGADGYMVTPGDWQCPGEWDGCDNVLYLPVLSGGGLEGVSA